MNKVGQMGQLFWLGPVMISKRANLTALFQGYHSNWLPMPRTTLQKDFSAIFLRDLARARKTQFETFRMTGGMLLYDLEYKNKTKNSHTHIYCTFYMYLYLYKYENVCLFVCLSVCSRLSRPFRNRLGNPLAPSYLLLLKVF